MRAAVVLAAALLPYVSVAHNLNHRRHKHRRAAHVGREITIVDPSFPQRTEVPEIVVYVDQDGIPVTTATETVVIIPGPVSTSSAEADKQQPPQPQPQSPQPPQPEINTSQPAAPVVAPSTSQPAEPALSPTNTPETSAPLPQPTQPPSLANVPGITYSPYAGSGGCKNKDQVEADLATLASKYSLIRFYGTDCDQVASAYAAAKKHGFQLFLGIFNLDPLDQEVAAIVSGVQGDWTVVDTVSVGNELVNSGTASPDRVLAAVKAARSQLRSAGYNGPVVTVDTFVAVLAHPELCQLSDYCAINCHPFFDLNTQASLAGKFVRETVDRVAERIGNGMRIVVTEAGWPWQGTSNGAAVPSRDNQQAAIQSITAAFADQIHNLILFTAFNDYWKRPMSATFFAEQFWGINAADAPTG